MRQTEMLPQLRNRYVRRSSKGFPAKDIVLETKDASYYQIKTDLFKRLVCYSTAKDSMANVVNIPVERALQIIALNKKGIRVDALSEQPEEKSRNEFGDVLSSDLQRFDKKRNKENKKRKDFRNNQDNNTSREADNRTDKNRKNRSRNRGRQNDNNNRDNSNRNRNNDNSRNQNNPDPK